MIFISVNKMFIEIRLCNRMTDHVILHLYTISKHLYIQYQNTYIQYRNASIQYQNTFSHFFTTKTKKEQANESAPEKFEPKKFLKPKRNKQMNLHQKNTFFIFVIHRHTVKYMITLCTPKLL